MNVNELKQERAALINRMQLLLDEAKKEKRDLTKDEAIQFDNLELELDGIDEKIVKVQEKNGRDIRDLEDRLKGNRRVREVASGGKATYRSIFGYGESATLNNGNFESFREYLEVATSGRFDPRLQELRTQLVKNGDAGGFAVPPEYGEILMDDTIEESIVLPRARIEGMVSAEKYIPAWDDFNHSANVYGGFTAVWTGENKTNTVQTAKLRQLHLQEKKLALYTNASREVLSNAPGFENSLRDAMKRATAHFLDTEFLVGTGVNRPMGVLNAPASVRVSRATANQISYIDLRSMFSRLHPAYAKEAVWVANIETLNQLLGIVDASNRLIFSVGAFSGNIAEAPPATLFGKPVIFTERTPALGSAGDLMLCNFRGYAVGLREQVAVETTDAANWSNDLRDFRCIWRVDGMPTWSKPLTPANGTSTLSPFVILNTP